MLKATNIYKSYSHTKVLKGVTFGIEKGEIVSIVGASGAGKSTLLQIMGTLDNADSGTMLINNEDITKLKGNKLAAFRNKNIGFVFQFHHLLPEFTALENVCLPAWIANSPKNVVEKRAKELLDLMNISHRLQHKPNQLSGGEQQRVAIARALINNPALVLADEPTGNLDSKNSEEIYTLIHQLQKEYQQTFVIVTHNTQLSKLGNRVLTMKDGVMV